MISFQAESLKPLPSLYFRQSQGVHVPVGVGVPVKVTVIVIVNVKVKGKVLVGSKGIVIVPISVCRGVSYEH